MTVKTCVEDLIKLLKEEGCINETQKAELINILYRGPVASS